MAVESGYLSFRIYKPTISASGNNFTRGKLRSVLIDIATATHRAMSAAQESIRYLYRAPTVADTSTAVRLCSLRSMHVVLDRTSLNYGEKVSS